MATIAFDIRVLTSERRSGVEEYTERLLEHLLMPDDGTQFVRSRRAHDGRESGLDAAAAGTARAR